MAERRIQAYQRLFEVRVLHHYWLDEGASVFDQLPAATQQKRLLAYDRRPFLDVLPTAATAKAIQGLQGVYKDTALGWLIAVPRAARIPADAVFEFVLTVRQAEFFDYTALTLPGRRIYGFYHPPTRKTFRYQENAPLLSNLTGVARGTGPAKALFLSREYPALTATDSVEALVLSGAALLQLTGDQPGAATRQLSAQASAMPVFLHQGDVPVIVPPPDLTGTPPARGIGLPDEVAGPVFALVQIAAVHPTDADFSCTAGDQAKPDPPVFQVRLKNRSSVWRYFNKANPGLPPADAGLFPITWFGNAGPRQKPTAGNVKADKTGTQITKLVSEIYE